VTGYSGYNLYKITTSNAAWVRLYTDQAARTADSTRLQGDPPPVNAGFIAEVITTGAETVVISPGIVGYNNENPVTNIIPIAVTNNSGASIATTVQLTIVRTEGL
jgi:hypothetical protein